MSEQTRFIVLVVGVVAVAAGLWFLLRPGSTPSDAGDPLLLVSSDTPVHPASHDPADDHSTPSSRTITRVPIGARRESTRAVGQIAGAPQSGVGVVKGEVVWADTKTPVEAAEVIAEIRDEHEGKRAPTVAGRWRTLTGRDGTFVLEQLPERRAVVDPNVHYRLYARSGDAYGESGFQLTDDQPAAYAKIELHRVGTISGQVVDASGEPVAGAWLSPHRYRPEGSERGSRARASSTAVTDESGRFTVADLRPGAWSFMVRSPDFVSTISDFAELGSDDLLVTLEGGMTVSGTVLDAYELTPVPGVEVRLAPKHQEAFHHRASGRSAAGGIFEITSVAATTYFVVIGDGQYVLAGSPTEIAVPQGDAITGLTIPVTLGGVVTGRAYDADTGQPLDGVVIRNKRSDGNEAQTDSDGYYRLEGLPEGPTVIGRKWREGYLHGEHREDRHVAVRLGEVVADVDFPMKKGLYLRGTVTDRQGRPIEFAHVRSEALNDSREGETTQTRENGTFEHRGFSPDTEVTLMAMKEDMEHTRVGPLTIGDADLDGVEIVMERGAGIEGEVVDPLGKPLPEIHVSAQGQGGQTGARTDADGRFSIAGLGPGVYTLSLREFGPDGAVSRVDNVEQVTVARGGKVEGVRLVFRPSPGASIAGRVIDRRRRPIDGVHVRAYGESGGPNTRTNEEGQFELTGLSPGSYRLQVHDRRYMPMKEELSVETGTRNIEIVLAGRGAVEGRVIDARTGQPIKHFQVRHMPGLHRAVHAYTGFGHRQAFFNEDGAFTLTNVDEGDATIFVTATGYIPAMQQLNNIAEYKPVRGLVFRLKAGGRIEGVVLDKGGEPVSDASIHVQSRTPEGYEQSPQAARTDGRGRFVIDGVSPEINGLSAHHQDFLPASVDVGASSGRTAEITIRMSRGGIIEGRVTVGGKPATGHVVTAISPEGGISRHVQTDARGRYSISGLPSGEVNVSPSAPSVIAPPDTTQTVIVAEDHITTVNFDL